MCVIQLTSDIMCVHIAFQWFLLLISLFQTNWNLYETIIQYGTFLNVSYLIIFFTTPSNGILYEASMHDFYKCVLYIWQVISCVSILPFSDGYCHIHYSKLIEIYIIDGYCQFHYSKLIEIYMKHVFCKCVLYKWQVISWVYILPFSDAYC